MKDKQMKAKHMKFAITQLRWWLQYRHGGAWESAALRATARRRIRIWIAEIRQSRTQVDVGGAR